MSNDWRMGRLAILDTETTGLTEADRICEIAVVIMENGKRLSAWSSLVNPGISIPADATAVHGITDEMVLAAPTIQQLRIEIANQLAGADAIVGYHSYSADFPWLERELPGILPVGPVYVDVLVLVRKVLRAMKGSSAQQVRCPIWTFDEDGYVPRSPKHIGRHSLGNVVDYLDALNDEPDVQSKLHRAEFDADCTGRILHILRNECNPNGPAFERWARGEHIRQTNSLEKFFAGLREADAAKRSARQTFEERLTAMVGARFDALEARINALAEAEETPRYLREDFIAMDPRKGGA